MSTTRTERIAMSPSERGALERRVARYVQYGRTLKEVSRACGISIHEVRAICEAAGVEVKGGNRL